MEKIRKILAVFVVFILILMIGISFLRAFVSLGGNRDRVMAWEDVIPHIRHEVFAGWNLTDWRSHYSDKRGTFLAKYAGCEKFSPINATDQEFSEMWIEDSEKYHINYEDVLWYMRNKCKLETDEQIEKKYQYLLDGTDIYPDMDEKKEGMLRIQSEKISRDYKLRFLSKEFTILKED